MLTLTWEQRDALYFGQKREQDEYHRRARDGEDVDAPPTDEKADFVTAVRAVRPHLTESQIEAMWRRKQEGG